MILGLGYRINVNQNKVRRSNNTAGKDLGLQSKLSYSSPDQGPTYKPENKIMVNINIRLATRATQMWQCLETFLIVTVKGRKTTGSKWVEARDTIKYPSLHRTAPVRTCFIHGQVNITMSYDPDRTPSGPST